MIGLGRSGALAEFVDVPVGNLFAVGEGVDPLTASLSEPLATAVRAIGLARPAPGSRVLVLGGGSIGLLCSLLLRDVVGELAMTARYDHQRQAGERLGVSVIGEQDAVAWGRAAQPDLVIETVGGVADTMDTAIRVAQRGGRVIVVGAFVGRVPVDLQAAMLKEIEIRPSYIYAYNAGLHEFEVAVKLLSRYGAELKDLQTHEFELHDVADAFRCAADKGSGAIKVVIVPPSTT